MRHAADFFPHGVDRGAGYTWLVGGGFKKAVTRLDTDVTVLGCLIRVRMLT
jgi:hypothetical protein